MGLKHLLALLLGGGLALVGGSYPFSDGRYPNGCLGEDSEGAAQFAGDLAAGETFSVTALLCDDTAYPWSPGGLGIRALALGKPNAQLVVSITSPTGVVTTHNDRLACVTPTAHLGPPEYIVGTLEAGTWTLAVKNVGTHTARDVSFQPWVHMAYAYWQMGYCPLSDQHVEP